MRASRRVAPRLAAAAFAGLLGLGCGEPDNGKIARGLHGVVTDAASGRSLAGVSIAFRSDTLNEASAKTDSDGSYALVVATDSEYGRIAAKKSGYATAVKSVYFDIDDVQIDIALNAK